MNDETIQEVTDVVSEVAPQGVGQAVVEFLGTDAGKAALTIMFIALTVLLTILLVRVANFFFKRTVKRLLDAGNSTATVVSFFRYIVVALVYFGGFSTVVSQIPALKAGLTSILTAGGIVAVVLGFASQEAMGSIVSGLMILAFKPFVIGDVVRYVDNDISGVIEEITLRHTTIRTWEHKRVIVPNSKMNSSIIENADYADSKVCVFLDIGVTYESDLERAKDVLSAEITKHPSFFDYRTADDRMNGAPPVVVRVVELADSAVVLRAWLWAKDNGTAAVMKSDLLQSVKQAYDKAGVDLAYPHLVVVNK